MCACGGDGLAFRSPAVTQQRTCQHARAMQMTALSEESPCAVSESSTLAELRRYVKHNDLHIKTSGAGRSKAVILTEILASIGAGTSRAAQAAGMQEVAVSELAVVEPTAMQEQAAEQERESVAPTKQASSKPQTGRFNKFGSGGAPAAAAPEGPRGKATVRTGTVHGVTLKAMLEELVRRHGWHTLGRAVPVQCFRNEPSVGSSLRFLRKTEWARAKVERLYTHGLPRELRNEWESAEEWADERAASAAKLATRADMAASEGSSRARMRWPRDSKSRRASAARMRMGVVGAGDAKKYASAAELDAAVCAYVAALPAGAVDDPTLPSPLNYKELNYSGRPDLVEGCMQFGGYLQVSQRLGLPVRIGVERPAAPAESGMRATVAKKTISAYNMFGKLDTDQGGWTEGETAAADALKGAAKKVAGWSKNMLGLPDTGKW